MKHLKYAVGLLVLSVIPVQAAEPTWDDRSIARTVVILEAHDFTGYCKDMDAGVFTDGLTKACLKAVQKMLKKPEDCTPERIAQVIEDDNQQCLAMPVTEFEKIILDGRNMKAKLVERMKERGLDSEKLFQEERVKLYNK